jgi:hypothetical protein
VTGACCYTTFYSWHYRPLAKIWKHSFDKDDIVLMNHISTAQMTLTLGALLCHDMSHVRALALIAARTRTLEPLCGPRHGLLLVGHCLTPK